MEKSLVCTIEELAKELASEKIAKYAALIENQEKTMRISELEKEIAELRDREEEIHNV